MAFGNNTDLLKGGAERVDLLADNTATTFEGDSEAQAFFIADGNVGDDTIEFGKNDSIITKRAIFDGNGDGFITFGENGQLDVDRTGFGNSKQGPDNLLLTSGAEEGEATTALRFLGNKGDLFVYADAGVRLDLEAANGTRVVKEGTVGDNMLTAGGSLDFLYDTDLGLNLGGDTITGFGADDRLITTSLLFDSNNDDIITFGTNGILDLTGENDPTGVEPSTGPGGQIDFGGTVTSLTYDEANNFEINGVNYYVYLASA